MGNAVIGVLQMKFWLFSITKIEYQNILIAVLHESKAAIFVQEGLENRYKEKIVSPFESL